MVIEGQRKGLPEGLRARKHRQTRERICEVALRLFLDRGFDGVTLDAIAEAADLSRRTLFHYFESKEAIVQSVERGNEDALRAALAASPPDLSPIDAVRNALLQVIGRYQTEEAVAIDRLMRSTDALRARKQANYERQEKALFSALCEKWPAPARRAGLRLVAMVGIGAMRLAAERWGEEDGGRPLAPYLESVFEQLRGEIIS